MINTYYLELPLSRTYSHGSEGVRAIEVLLFKATHRGLVVFCKTAHHYLSSVQI